VVTQRVLAIPTIETARLVLRGPRLADHDASSAMWGDPQVTRYIGGRPFTREEVWSRLLRYLGQWAAFGYGYWTACDRETGAFVGELGVAEYRRALDRPLDAPEVGWALVTTAHGRGLASEGVGAVLAWCDARFPRTTCIIDPGNAASLRLAARHGFAETRRATYHGADTVVMAREAASR
jgi:RimJ/RimL family protein N-acetyltransferase